MPEENRANACEGGLGVTGEGLKKVATTALSRTGY